MLSEGVCHDQNQKPLLLLIELVFSKAFQSLELQTLVVSAVVNFADWRTDHFWKLAIVPDCLGDAASFSSSCRLVDVLSCPFAKAA